MPRPAVEPVLRFAPELLLAAQGVRVAIFDVDGVLTDGRIYIGEQGEAFKAFSTLDGHGLKLLAQGGIVPVVITGRDSPAVRRRVADLGIAQAVYGASDKLAAATPMLARLGVGWDAVAAMGAPTRLSRMRTTSRTRSRWATRASTRSPTWTFVAGFAADPLTVTWPPAQASDAAERVL